MLKQFMTSGSLRTLATRQIENDDGADDEIEGFDFDAIRENFKEAKGRDIQVSDSVLQFAAENSNGEFDTLMEAGDSEGVFAFVIRVEEAAKRVAVSDIGITALVAKIDDTFEEEITSCIDAVMKNKTTAVDIYAQLHRVFTLDELNSMPLAGSEPDDVKGTNYTADKVKRKDKVTGIEITTVWLNDFVSATKRGKEWEKELKDVSDELKKSGTVSRFKNTPAKELEALKATLTGKRNGLRSMFKRAINTHHAFEAVRMMPLVNIEWIPGDKKSGIRVPSQYGEGKFDNKTDFYITSSPKCIWMFPKGQASNGKPFSVTQLIGFDVPKALRAGGTMGDLIDTLKKGGDTPDASGDGSKMDIEEAVGTFQRFANFMDVKDNAANYKRILADRKREDRRELLETLEAVYHSIAPLWKIHEADLEALKEADAQKLEKAKQIAGAK